jgi:2,4-dienoyl-CoA reductase-like NADH-dependent reductase (Old Yellow Enzyme family)
VLHPIPVTAPANHLFAPLILRSLTLPHRTIVSPMCEYSSTDGFLNDWHFVHLGSRAIGGAALVITEASAVNPEGRINPYWPLHAADALHQKLTWPVQYARAANGRPEARQPVTTPRD